MAAANNPVNINNPTARITVLWAFSESVLGGFLHVFKVPFSGIILGGLAVVFISLIAYYSESRNAVLKSTFIILAIKLIISPQTPINAYFSVFIQGLAGHLLFYNKRFYKTSALLLGIITLSLFAFQKFFVLTIIFGNTIWDSIDIVGTGIQQQLGISKDYRLENLSILIMSLYVLLHAVFGILFGRLAGKLPGIIKNNRTEYSIPENKTANYFDRKKKKGFWSKKLVRKGILFFILGVFFILSYLSVFSLDKNNILFMIVRSLFIIAAWYMIFSPLLTRWLTKYIKRKNSRYLDEVNDIILHFPKIKKIANRSWQFALTKKGLLKIKYFVVIMIVTFLFEE